MPDNPDNSEQEREDVLAMSVQWQLEEQERIVDAMAHKFKIADKFKDERLEVLRQLLRLRCTLRTVELQPLLEFQGGFRRPSPFAPPADRGRGKQEN
jgi:hypothetical protein